MYAAAVLGVVPLAAALLAGGFAGNYPAPLPATAPSGVFSEGRAMEHVRALAGVGDAGDPFRGVRYTGEGRGRMGAAEEYLRGQLEAVGRAAAGRGDLEWGIEEHSASGGFNQHFLMHDMCNSYTDVRNIALRIAPKGSPSDAPAVLVNAHYDSTVGTPGASDCASCVGVGLEMLHAVAHNASLGLAGPLILVLNSAEETFMQAAHGFATQHPWAPQVGAVINLESTGSGGPDLVFRMRGALPVRAYAESATRPHANVAAQDLFATGAIPADTDFYVFAHPEYGDWPGIDVATILDGEAYHTNRDVPERIWPGSLQSLGENMLPTALRMAQLLQETPGAGEGAFAGRRPGTDQGTFFSVLNAFTVRYPHGIALLLHLLPSPLVLVVSGRIGVDARRLARGAGKQAAAALLAVACSAAVAVLAPAAVGRSMAWYGKYVLAGLIFIPSAAAGMLLPYSQAAARKASKVGKKPPTGDVEGLVADLCGSAALLAAIAVVGTFTVTPNSGFITSSSSAFSLAAAVLLHLGGGGLPAWKGFAVAALAVLPGLISWDLAFTTWLHLLGRIALVGSAASPLAFLIPELAMGAITGLLSFLAFGWFAPLFSHALQLGSYAGQSAGKGAVGAPRKLRAPLVLLGVSLNASIFGALVFEAFSAHYPKRVLLLHTHTVVKDHKHAGSRSGSHGSPSIARTQWILGGADFTALGPVLEPLKWPVLGCGLTVCGRRKVDWRPAQKDDLLGLYPVTDLLNDAVAVDDPRGPSKEDMLAMPDFAVTVVDRHCGGSPTEPHAEGVRCCRVHAAQAVEARATALHGVRIRGPVSWWSFTSRQHPDQRPVSMEDEKGPFYIARHAGSSRISFEVEASGPEELQLEIAVLNLEPSERVLDVLRALPGFTAPMPATSYNFRATC